MTPDEPHPLEGRLRELPLPGACPAWRDRVLFEAGRASASRGRSGILGLAGLAAGFLAGALVPFPVGFNRPGVEEVARLPGSPVRPDPLPEAAPAVSSEDRLAWETRRRILADGLEAVPVPVPVAMGWSPLSLRDLIREESR